MYVRPSMRIYDGQQSQHMQRSFVKNDAPNSEGNNRPEDQNVGSLVAIVCHRAQEEEEHRLDREADSVGQEYNGVDSSILSKEMKYPRIACSFIEIILESCWLQIRSAMTLRERLEVLRHS